MTAVEVCKGVFWVGVDVRTDDKFEGMWPIPQGVSLNSYVVKGQKTAIIDLVREWRGSAAGFYRQLESVNVDLSSLEYIVLNHLEPDHTEALCSLMRSAPKATILTTKKGVELVEVFYGLKDRVRAVVDGETLDLGGKTLRFREIPFVHWPETMATYVEEDQVLFSCDAFGGFGALNGALFDDEIGSERWSIIDRETLRYYANIVAVFSPMVLKAIEKLSTLPIKIIAPSHGVIWRKNPQRVVEYYRKLANYKTGKGLKPKITMVFGTMYGNTEAIANAVLRGFSRVHDVEVEVFEVPDANSGSYILASAWESGGLAIGAPTYEAKMFPPMACTLALLNSKSVTNRNVFWFGSFGWSGGARREFDRSAEEMKWNVCNTFDVRGGSSLELLSEVEKHAEEFAKLIREKYHQTAP